MATAHISSDMPSKAFTTLMGDSAADHAKQGDTTYGVDNLPSLTLLFRKLKEKKVRLTHLDFHTHGSPGSLALGSDHLNRATLLRDFSGKGFESVFANDARIFFHGCNVAEKARGELFLAEVAVTFLKSGGGRVGGSNMTGIVSIWGSGKTYRLPNTAVHAYVKSGGLVWLEYESGEAHLKHEHIQNHVDFIENEAIPLLENDEDAAQQVVLTRSVQIDKARKHLARAKSLLKAKVNRNIASIRTLYNAHWNMRQAGRIVSTLSRNSGRWTQLKLAYAMDRDEMELYPLH